VKVSFYRASNYAIIIIKKIGYLKSSFSNKVKDKQYLSRANQILKKTIEPLFYSVE
jgi:hypothetical protein